MLLHQPETEQTPLSNLPRWNMPPAPEELARAIITLESERQGAEHTQTQANVSAPTLKACGMDITPQQLLAEVQAQRLRMDQDAAMTRQKLRDTPFWLLAGGAAFSTIAALFLLYTSYAFAVRLRDTNALLASTQHETSASLAIPSISTLIKEWSYKDAPISVSSYGGRLSSATTTTMDAYDSIWWYYANKAGYPVTDIKVGMPGGVAKHLISEGSMGGAFANGGQAGSYFIWSGAASPNRTATFTRVTSQGTINATLTYDATHKQTNIHLTGSAP